MMSDQDPLESFFEAARNRPEQPSAALMVRVEADADAVARSREVSSQPIAVRPSFLSLIGGWRAGAGLVAATVAGIMIGYAQPVTVTDFVPAVTGDVYDLSDVGAGYGFEVFAEEQG